jgi:hypothetical protein
MVDHGHADAEGVPKVHRGHGSELVDKFSAHPHALGVIMVDGIEETVFLG